jgi:hypothetical protein
MLGRSLSVMQLIDYGSASRAVVAISTFRLRVYTTACQQH